MKKRIFAVLFTALMLLSLIAACNNTQNNDSSPGSSPSAGGASPSAGAASPSSGGASPSAGSPGAADNDRYKALEDYDDVLVVTALSNRGGPVLENETMTHAWLLEKYKLDIQCVWETDNIAARLNIILAGGEPMPDIVSLTTANKGFLSEMIDLDWCLPLNDYFDLLPDYSEYVGPDILDFWSTDGVSYMLPSNVVDPNSIHRANLMGSAWPMFMRKDILDITGMDIPLTFNELYDFCVAANEMVDRSNPLYENFVPLYFTGAHFDYFFNFWLYGFGLPAGATIGPITSGAVPDESSQMMIETFMWPAWQKLTAYLAKFYREGLIHPETLIWDGNECRARTREGIFGMYVVGWGDYFTNTHPSLIELGLHPEGPEGYPLNMPFPRVNKNEPVYWFSTRPALGNTPMVVSKSAPDPVRLIKFLNWQNTQYGGTATWFGGPDEEYGYWYELDGVPTYNQSFADRLNAGEANINMAAPWQYTFLHPGGDLRMELGFLPGGPGMSDLETEARAINFFDYYGDIRMEKYNLMDKGPHHRSKMTDINAIVRKWRAEIILRSTSDEDALNMYYQMVEEVKRAGIEDVQRENYLLYKKANGLS